MSTQIITTIAELKEHVAIDFISEFSVIAYAVEDRENEIKNTYLGDALFAELAAYKAEQDASSSASASASASSSGSATSTQLAKLLYYVQRAIANFAFMDYIPEGQLNISEKGIRIATNEEMKTAFEWQIRQLSDKYKKTGYMAIENMIQYLSDNLDSFSSWKGTSQHTELLSMFIWSSKDFSKYYNIAESRVVFRELVPAIKKAEQFYIQSAIGETYYDQLKAAILADDVEAVDQVIVNKIKPALAHFAIYVAFNEYGSVITDLKIEYNRAMSNLRDRNSMIQTQMESAEQWGQRYLDKLVAYLDANASSEKYSAYYDYSQESSSYSTSDNRFYINDSDDGIFVM